MQYEENGRLNQAFRYFNEALFRNALPNVLVTTQLARGAYFPARRGTQMVDEIALNLAAMHDRPDRQIVSTLVHEMVHCWQHHFGRPGRRSYHNKEFAAKMDEIGLVPSHTGEPGGKRTGQSMTHYIVDGGPFDTAWQDLVRTGYEFDYPYWERQVDQAFQILESAGYTEVRYTCPICLAQVWGKPNLRVNCGNCNNEPMLSEKT